MTQKKLLAEILYKTGWNEFMEDTFMNPFGYVITLNDDGTITDHDRVLKRYIKVLLAPASYATELRKKYKQNPVSAGKFPPLPQKQDITLTKRNINKLNKMFKQVFDTKEP